MNWRPLMMIAPLFLVACHHGPVETPPPDRLYSEAVRAVEKGGLFGTRDCLKAEQKIDEMRRRYPYHARTIDGELLLADCAAKDGRGSEAVGRWEAFLRLHPGHERTAEVLERVADANLEQYDDYDRDLSPVVRALNAANTIIREHPASPQAASAVATRARAREILAQRELYVARFYRRTGEPLAAIERYRNLVATYGDVAPAAAARAELEALERSVDFPAPPTSVDPTTPRKDLTLQ